MANELKNIKSTPRNVYGWQGSNGTAYTITAECPDGRRRVCRAMWAGKGLTRLIAADRWSTVVSDDELY